MPALLTLPSRVHDSATKKRSVPKTFGYLCWVCGREFGTYFGNKNYCIISLLVFALVTNETHTGTASIGLHEPKCADLWQKRESRKSTALQREPLQKPEILNSSLSRTKRNAAVREYQEAVMMERCFLCPRTFAEGRLVKHLASHKAELADMKPEIRKEKYRQARIEDPR